MDLKKRLELMASFTQTYKETEDMPKSLREITCMATQFPEVFVQPLDHDLFVGRFIMLPIGHGLEWAHLGGGDVATERKSLITHQGSSIPEMNSAGSSYYGLVGQLKTMASQTEDPTLQTSIDDLIQYWQDHDTHTKMMALFSKTHNSTLYDLDITNFEPPMLALTRLSGIELDYKPLLAMGIEGLKSHLQTKLKAEYTTFIDAGIQGLNLLEDSIHYYINRLEEGPWPKADKNQQILHSLKDLLSGKPTTFHSAMQLLYLYSQLAGVVNYGRMDDVLGDFLHNDLAAGRITESDAITFIASMWHLINDSCNRGNGRVIIGGAGRSNPDAANIFARLAIQATMATMIVKPQLTLRMDASVPEDIYDLALDAIGKGCTFPMIYNDGLNVPSIEKAMEVTAEDAKQYVPYGCGEYIINGRGTGSPNACVNFTKVLQLALNQGIDPYDNVYRGGSFTFKPLETLTTYEALESYYYDYLDYILMTAAHFQQASYQFMAKQSSFVMASLLMDDCISRGKAILDGGIRYYSGVNEFYGFTNAMDSLAAIKQVVYDNQAFTLQDVVTNLSTKAKPSPQFRAMIQALKEAPKFGNDLDEVDAIGVQLHEHACQFIRHKGKEVGLHSYLAVNINNNANTRWGLKTAASPDGRVRGEHLAPGNNPHSGRDQEGITAMLNSVSKFRPDIHAGYVQNLKCSPKLFNEERAKSKMLLNTYWKKPGGTQIMINVVDQATLLDAKKHPDKHQNLIVRCGGFSAKFVELDTHTQDEILARTCNA